MLDSVSGSNPAMRISGSQAAAGSRMTVNSTEAAASGGAEARGNRASENFKAALTERFERAQRTGQADPDKSPEEVKELVDSISRAVSEVKSVYGQDAANDMMANILKGADKNGLSLEGLTESVGSALRDIGQTGTASQLKSVTEKLNTGLGLSDDDSGPADKGLSQAINNFYNLESKEVKDGYVAQGFTAQGRWGEVAAADPEKGEIFIEGTPESAREALENSSSFALNDMDEEALNDLVDFLRKEDAAAALENASGSANFMSTMDTVISEALKDGDSATASKLESYLNNNLKEAVGRAAESQNIYGFVEFQGWEFSTSASTTNEDGTVSAGVTEVKSNWRYTNRDDVTFQRTSQPKAIQEEKEQSPTAVTASGSNALVDQFNQMVSKYTDQTGGLIDTQA